MARKKMDKWYCEACAKVFRSSEAAPHCPECGGDVDDCVVEYEGQDLLSDEEVFDLVDSGIIANV